MVGRGQQPRQGRARLETVVHDVRLAAQVDGARPVALDAEEEGAPDPGAPAGADDAFERTVVLWPMQGAGATDMLGLTSQNSPRVVNIPADSAQTEVPVASEYVLGAVSVEGGLGIIPDLEKISRNLFG